MIWLTLDASVILKWFLARDEEPDWPAAEALAGALRQDSVRLVQPPHWLAEVMAVIVRRRLRAADAALKALVGLDVPVLGTEEVYRKASRLAEDTGAHLFDTLYHAVALLMPSCTLLTADRKYLNLAGNFGRIKTLKNFRAPDG